MRDFREWRRLRIASMSSEPKNYLRMKRGKLNSLELTAEVTYYGFRIEPICRL